MIEAVAQQKEADLIVLGTNGRRGIGKFVLGSVAEEILRRAECPVLTVGPHSPSEAPHDAKFRKIVYATDFGDGSPAAAAYAVALAEEHPGASHAPACCGASQSRGACCPRAGSGGIGSYACLRVERRGTVV